MFERKIYDEMLSGSDLNILDEKLLSWLDLDKNELEIMDNSEMYTITFDTNWATSKESITLTWWTKLIELVGTGYSYTSNISEDWTKNDNYWNYWGDDHIVNKVVTITWANILEVTIRYGWESDRYDWACVWEWNHSDYSASNKYDLSISWKLWWWKSSDAWNTKTYKIKWDTVTFWFTSDVSDCWTDWYWYYAIVNWFVDRLWSNPERDFSNFEWWYLDDDTKFDYENYVLESDLNLHAKYKCNLWYIDYGDSCWKDETIYSATIIWDDDDRNDFEYGIIAISDWTDWFVIMDRNLWARSKWDWVTWTAEKNSEYESDSDSYWYYYQWWNNWWFSTKTTTIGSNTEIVVDDEFIPSKYSSWVRNSAWPWTSQTNLRWWDSSMEVVKKWPCPEWWHVPSTNEWQSLVSLWCKNNKGNTSCSDWEWLARDLLLPPAGARKYNSVSYDNKGVYGDYLACTAYSNGAYRMWFGKTVIVSNQNGNKSIWFPVRCFRNSQDKIIVTYHTNWWRLEYDYWELEKWEKLNNVPIPTRENYRFMWWFTDENFNEPFDPSADITGSFDLYADWRCWIGTTETEDWLCIRDVTEYSVVLEWNWWSNMNNFKYKKIDLWDYVIMDRDLWATKIWNAWYYYQWWNNYWFEWKWPSSTSNPAVILSSQIPSKYSSWLRNTNNPWTTEINMWGDLSWTDVARQWPCPEWWHVPSNEDWNRLYDEWRNSQNKSTYYQFYWKNFVSDLNFVYNWTIEGGGSSYTSYYNYYPYIA